MYIVGAAPDILHTIIDILIPIINKTQSATSLRARSSSRAGLMRVADFPEHIVVLRAVIAS
jgi:hypothetical protein